MDVFNALPGGGARDAKPPPEPLGQVRAMWPTRPQFCVGDQENKEIVICIASHIALLTPILLNPQTGTLR